MKPLRRTVLHTAGAGSVAAVLASLGLLAPLKALAQSKAFQTKTLAETLAALGATGAADSRDIVITAPDIAENGAVVPIGVKSNLPKTEMIALLVEKNPSLLAGSYEILAGAEPDVSMRVKMGQSSDVFAVVKADGKFFITRKEVKVTLGGCGG
ncbi:MAG: thiosulfate oxidation carrier protein SoxY [Burkholderiales bacterium]|jgi:sulfur-oxidizing protein SoxY